MRPHRLLGILGALLVAAPAAAQEPQGLIELLIDVRVQDGPTAVLPALGGDTTLYLPLRDVLHLTEVLVTEVVPGHRVAGLLLPAGRRFVFDTDSPRLVVGDSAYSLDAGAVLWVRDELYVRPDLLAMALDVRIVATQAELLAYIL